MHQIYIIDRKSQSLQCVWILLCCSSHIETINKLNFPSQKLPCVCRTGAESLWQTKLALLLQLPASVQEAQGALLDLLPSLLAGCYLEDSWKTSEYLQDCSKLQWVGINLVWESNGTAKLKYSFFFFFPLNLNPLVTRYSTSCSLNLFSRCSFQDLPSPLNMKIWYWN